MYYTGRLEVFNENFPAVSNSMALSFTDLESKLIN